MELIKSGEIKRVELLRKKKQFHGMAIFWLYKKPVNLESPAFRYREMQISRLMKSFKKSGS